MTNIPDILNTPPVKRITLTELAHQEGVAPCTVHRWATKGIQGVRLPTAKVGLKRVTTRSVFLAWCEQVTTSVTPSQLRAIPRNDMQPAIEVRAARAERELARLGLIAGDAESKG